MSDRHQYSKPPLIEAVIELRFDQAMSDKDLTRAKDRLHRAFPAVDEMKTFQAKLEAHGAVQDMGLAGYKMTAKNGLDVVLLQRNILVTSRLAPYEGWDALVAKTQANYEIFERAVGFRRIVRLGSRFVNRIDVPDRLLANKPISDLLNIKIALPAGIATSQSGFSLATNFVHSGSDLKVLVQVAMGDPVLIDHTSVFVDLDCSIDQQIPMNMEELWKLLATIRDPKDEIFESLLTPEIRELFR
ncbi:hypothetical protein C2U70_07020 [Bradyrhizobium guangdongense]|uniref:TIGR04255 family protein n=1 Tax=Bradyrhizobium guangdongense TaxID=1325090 RepID=UPI00112E8DAF|nr:TIGR04255 family protein [Bradyrhizobium guangdongense]TPQ39528.1 hypothetical protein C2U70_07020 [Bradyrhizobium guangdongense]